MERKQKQTAMTKTDKLKIEKPVEEVKEPRATLDETGLHFNDPNITEGYKTKLGGRKDKNFKSIEWVSISSSLIGSVLGCPARAMGEKYILKDLIPMDPLSPNALGSAFHKVMEIFFRLDPKDRSNEKVRKAYFKALEEDEFEAIRKNSYARAWVRKCITLLWQSGFDWRNIKTAQVPTGKKDDSTEPGLEYFVKGNIGSAQRQSLGFIDMLAIDPEDESKVQLIDWKTGKHPHIFDPNDKYPDFDYTRQQTMYAMLLENQGYDVSAAHLVYPQIEVIDDHGNTVKDEDGNVVKKGFIQTIPIHDEKVRDRTVDEIEQVSAIIDDSIKVNTWEYQASPLCSWCPLVNVCPAAMKIKKANAVESRSKQPSPEDLKGQIECAL